MGWSEADWAMYICAFTACTCLTLLCWSEANRVSCVRAFAGRTCLKFSLPGWFETDRVACVCAFTDRMCLTFSMLGWSEANRVSCVCAFADRTCLTFSLPGWFEADTVLCLCAFAASMCLTFSLSEADWALYFCAFSVLSVCHFPRWIGVRLTVSCAGGFTARTCLKFSIWLFWSLLSLGCLLTPRKLVKAWLDICTLSHQVLSVIMWCQHITYEWRRLRTRFGIWLTCVTISFKCYISYRRWRLKRYWCFSAVCYMKNLLYLDYFLMTKLLFGPVWGWTSARWYTMYVPYGLGEQYWIYICNMSNGLSMNYLPVQHQILNIWWNTVGWPGLRQSMSALMGDLDLYPWVFQIQNAIPGSVQVSATRWLRAVSQKLTGSQVLVGPQVLGSTYKYSGY